MLWRTALMNRSAVFPRPPSRRAVSLHRSLDRGACETAKPPAPAWAVAKVREMDGVERQPTSQAPCSSAEHHRLDCWQWGASRAGAVQRATVLPPPPSSQPPRLGPVPDAMKLAALALMACALAIGASAGEEPACAQPPPSCSRPCPASPLPCTCRARKWTHRSAIHGDGMRDQSGGPSGCDGGAPPRHRRSAHHDSLAHQQGLTRVLQAPCPSSPTTTATLRAASPRTTAAAPATRRRCPMTRCRSSSSTL